MAERAIDFAKARRAHETRLSELQVYSLLWLKLGWPFGLDGRTARGFVRRGWIVLEFDTLGPREPGSTMFGGISWDRPVLTCAGLAVADRLARQIPAEFAKMQLEMERKWRVRCNGDGTVTICPPDSRHANDNEES